MFEVILHDQGERIILELNHLTNCSGEISAVDDVGFTLGVAESELESHFVLPKNEQAKTKNDYIVGCYIGKNEERIEQK